FDPRRSGPVRRYGRPARRGAPPPGTRRSDGAGNGTRTRDIKLGKLALYQLSYARPNGIEHEESSPREPPRSRGLRSAPVRNRFRTGYTGAMQGPGRTRDADRTESLYFFPDKKVTADEARHL